MKFVIVSPRQHCGGGPIVLHRLCKELENMGYDAKIWECDVRCNKKATQHLITFWTSYILSELKYIGVWQKIGMKSLINKFVPNAFDLSVYSWLTYQPVSKCRRKWTPFIDKDTIVVYPEVFFGNILRSQHTVRWLLGHTAMYDHDKSYDEGDLFFAFRDVFNDPKRNPTNRKLQINHFDLDLYRQTNFGERSGNCYIIRKGYTRDDLPSMFDGPIIDNMTEEQKVQTFNKCERVYSYDTQTAYSQIAALCGCISIVVPEPGKTKSDYLKSDDGEAYGVAFGDSESEVTWAIQTREKLQEKFAQIDKNNRQNVQNFVKECESYFMI